MGNDGGSIPTRRELVKSAARLPTISEMKATTLEALAHAWTVDPISDEPLDLDSAVSDWQGKLYNYETILEGLASRDDGPEGAGAEVAAGKATVASTGIKSLRDVVKLKLKQYHPAGSRDKAMWACPVSLKELGPTTKAVYLVPCGHVFAEVAMKKLQEEHVCPECSEAFKEENVISLLPTDKSDLEKLRQRMENLRSSGLAHSLKKDKSLGNKKKRKPDDKDGKDTEDTEKEKGNDKGKVVKSNVSSRLSNINNPMTASLTAKVMAEQEERNKRRKLAAAG